MTAADFVPNVVADFLDHPRIADKLTALIGRAVAAELAKSAADTWLSAKQAARHLYGTDAKEEAFRKLRSRQPALDQMSVGTGKNRRWRRSDLDNFLTTQWSK